MNAPFLEQTRVSAAAKGDEAGEERATLSALAGSVAGQKWVAAPKKRYDFEEVRFLAAGFGFIVHIRSRGEETGAKKRKPAHNDFVIIFPTLTGKNYAAKYCDDLAAASWIVVQTATS